MVLYPSSSQVFQKPHTLTGLGGKYRNLDVFNDNSSSDQATLTPFTLF